MKTAKNRLFLLLAVVVCAFVFCGCAELKVNEKSEPKTIEEVMDYMTENGYRKDLDLPEGRHILMAVGPHKPGMYVLFYRADNEEQFNASAKNIEEDHRDKMTRLLENDNTMCSFTEDNEYYVMIRKGFSILYVHGSEDNKDEIEKIFKDLGYGK